jgi:hypothetical protein
MGGVIGKIDEFGKPAWIALIVLSFIVFHPLGFVMLLFVLGSGRMGRIGWCGRHRAGRWYYNEERREESRWSPPWRTSSGNSAFDEYRTETLKRLEDEQREFKEFLDRLRHAKDKAEFDQFMADRSRRPQPPEAPPQA